MNRADTVLFKTVLRKSKRKKLKEAVGIGCMGSWFTSHLIWVVWHVPTGTGLARLHGIGIGISYPWIWAFTGISTKSKHSLIHANGNQMQSLPKLPAISL